MAKRVRGTQSTHRPGGQGPSRTKKTTDTSSAPTDASSVDIDGAVESVAGEYTEISIEESAPVAAPAKRKRTRRAGKAKADSLEARVAAENIYVRADLRRILVVSGVLIAALAVAWVVFVMMDVLNLY